MRSRRPFGFAECRHSCLLKRVGGNATCRAQSTDSVTNHGLVKNEPLLVATGSNYFGKDEVPFPKVDDQVAIKRNIMEPFNQRTRFGEIAN